jgi:hypothetical protein
MSPGASEVVLSAMLGELAREAGWILVRPGEEVYLAEFDDAFVFAAVPWSEWDARAARALDTYVRRLAKGAAVVLFNIDKEPPDRITIHRFPDLAELPYGVPVIARYRAGCLERAEQGMAAVKWMEELADIE